VFRNVLVGVDGSPNGRDAVALATRLLAEGGRLTLVHVYPGRLHPLRAIAPGLQADERRSSEALLEQERASTAVRAELLSAMGHSPGATLHGQAEELEGDLIVVGSSRRGLLGRAMLGDETRRALNGAPCAVAVAATGYAERPVPLARIGVGYNESPESRAALAAARELAAATRARVEALEVISIPTYAYTGVPAIGEEIDMVLKDADERMRALPDVEGRAVYGLTGEELAAFGDGLDLLVVGSRSYGPWRRLVLGSTSDYLGRSARCSLLVLPRAATVAAAGEGAAGQAAGAPGVASAGPAA
jgi:nucleotide-binding universal stress UspA family protein